jgi:hypothetical protein
VGRSEQPIIAMASVATAAETIQVFGNIEPQLGAPVVCVSKGDPRRPNPIHLRHTKNAAEVRQIRAKPLWLRLLELGEQGSVFRRLVGTTLRVV